MFYERGYTCVGLLKDRSFVFGSNLMMDFEVCVCWPPGCCTGRVSFPLEATLIDSHMFALQGNF